MVHEAFDRHLGRYAELRSLRCAENGGIEAVVCVKGFREEVRIALRKIQFATDGVWIIPLELEADKEGIDALLKDMVQGKKFMLPQKIRPYAKMLNKIFPS